MHNRTKQYIYDFAEQHYDPKIVAINHDAIKRLVLPSTELTLLPSFLPQTYHARPQSGIAFLVALNTINFMFWDVEETDDGRRLKRYAFDGKEGAMGMRAAFDRFWKDTSNGLAYVEGNLTAEDVTRYFGDIPDPSGRAENLNDVLKNKRVVFFAQQLYRKILGTRAVDADDALEMSRIFPQAYRDPFFKREQLALAMVAGFLGECGIIVDTSGLTMFADYQVPRSLRAMELLVFSPELVAMIESLTLLPEGPGPEYAICSAVILIGRAMAEHFGVPEAVLDNFLWQYRKQAGTLQFHLCRPKQRY
jgi:hypothetical protein